MSMHGDDEMMIRTIVEEEVNAAADEDENLRLTSCMFFISGAKCKWKTQTWRFGL
jgi:hypothetical protein